LRTTGTRGGETRNSSGIVRVSPCSSVFVRARLCYYLESLACFAQELVGLVGQVGQNRTGRTESESCGKTAPVFQLCISFPTLSFIIYTLYFC